MLHILGLHPCCSAPILELARNELVQSNMEEGARIFFTNNSLTVNLIPQLLALALGGLLLLPLLAPLLGLLFGGGGGGSDSTGGGTIYQVSDAYGAPAPSYGAPEYRADEGYEEFRSLFSNFLDSNPGSSQSELTKRIIHEVAGPTLTQIGNAAAKLIQ